MFLVSGEGRTGSYGAGGEIEGPALVGGLGGTVGEGEGEGASGPILGRSDDWPLARPGDARPYVDFLLVVFSGDDTDALAKRQNMRDVSVRSTLS